MKPTRTILSSALLALVCVTVGAVSAHASPTAAGEATVSITGWNPQNNDTSSYEWHVPIANGQFSTSTVYQNTAMWNGQMSTSGNTDPFVNLAFGITNNLAVPVEFTFSIAIPITPIPGGTLHGGSTGGSVTDSNNNGVGGLTTITSVPGTPFYSGRIDGVGVLSIYPDPTSIPAGGIFAFPGQTVNIPALNPGLPGPTLPSGPALLSIGIEHHFKLAPGDSMSASSFFIVQPVPEPTSMLLAGCGVVGLLSFAWRSRRRRLAMS
jgi:hypothetical protein